MWMNSWGGLDVGRAALAMAAARDEGGALAYAKRMHPQWGDGPAQFLQSQGRPRVVGKDATTPIDSNDFPLADQARTEFVQAVENATLLGRVPFQRAPFNVKLTDLTGGGEAAWVDENGIKPAIALQFKRVGRLEPAKVAAIVGFTDELRRVAAASVDQIFTRALVNASASRLDASFLDPTNAGGNGEPASIAYGAPTVAATGDLVADMAASLGLLAHPSRAVFLANSQDAVKMAALRAANGDYLFDDVGAAGGSALRTPLYTSDATPPGVIVACDPSQIYIATDGPLLDEASYASIDYGDGKLVSLWTANCYAWRVEYYANWLVAGPNAIAVIAGALASPVTAKAKRA